MGLWFMIAGQQGKRPAQTFLVFKWGRLLNKILLLEGGFFHFGEGSFVFQGIFQFGWIGSIQKLWQDLLGWVRPL
jgi:hypothetical protein